MPTPVTSLWVCVDCIMLAANGEVSDPPPACPPMDLLAGHDVTIGLSMADHAEDCPNYPEWIGAECDCETVAFSTMPCEGCGSRLAGERHAMTVWE